jgi:hypothetical protein
MNVQMTPIEGRVFDLIMRTGDDGILARDLVDIVWPDDPAPAALKNLRVVICNLNSKLALRDYRIVNRGSYYLLRTLPTSPLRKSHQRPS